MKNNLGLVEPFDFYGKQLQPATISWIATNIAPLVWDRIDKYMLSTNSGTITFEEAIAVVEKDPYIMRLLDHAVTNDPVQIGDKDVGFWAAIVAILPAVVSLAGSIFGGKGKQSGQQQQQQQESNFMEQWLQMQTMQQAQQQQMFQQILTYGLIGAGGIAVLIVMFLILKNIGKGKPKRRVVKRIIREVPEEA